MEEQFRKILGDNIRAERSRKHLSQEKLAEIAEFSAKHLNAIETAKVTPSIYIVFKIAKALDINVDKLLE